MTISKGFFVGIAVGFVYLLLNLLYGIAIVYGTYLFREDCATYSPGNITRALGLVLTATFSLSQALAFISELSEARGAATSVFSTIQKKSEIDIRDTQSKKHSFHTIQFLIQTNR